MPRTCYIALHSLYPHYSQCPPQTGSTGEGCPPNGRPLTKAEGERNVFSRQLHQPLFRQTVGMVRSSPKGGKGHAKSKANVGRGDDSEYRVLPRSALRQSGWAWLGWEEFVTTSNTYADTSKE